MYDIFEKLMKEKGVNATQVARETGIPRAAFTDWKKNRGTPKMDKMMKLADYFGVTIEYLLTGEKVQKNGQPEEYYLDSETAEVAQEIKENDHVLFDAYRSDLKDKLVAYAEKLMELERMEKGE